MIDSRDSISAQKSKENEVHCPEGTRICFTGGQDYNYHKVIWNALDATLKKYPDMILLHGGNIKGAECIAAKWAENRDVTQVIFKPDFKTHNRAAPFKRNKQMMNTAPQDLIHCPGNGINDNLADTARKLGIKVLKLGAQ